MKKRLLALLLIGLLLLSTGDALAQAYSFNVSKEVVNVYWNEDGTESIDYVFTFNNDSFGHVIDYVDLSLPNSNFNESTITADVSGNPVNDISASGYEGTGSGVAIGLGQYAISPGGTGTVHAYVGKVNAVLYNDSKDSNYVSADFVPAYFKTAHGTTDMTVTYHFPKAVQPSEPRWHSAPDNFPSQPKTGFDDQGRITYTWQNPAASASQSYLFGASFPKKYVPASAIQRENPFAFLGTINWGFLLPFGCVGFFALIIFLSAYSDRKRRLQYLPPKIAIEGHGIKRGLTAIEAAILLEEPLDKILTMILFSVIKKNAAQVTTKDPLEIKAITPEPPDLQPYEKEFIQAFAAKGLDRRKLMQDMMVNLVKSLSAKMKGFSRKETVAYYKDIMDRAWQQVESAGTPEVKSEKFNEVMEWTMLDRRFNERTQEVFRGGPVFIPMWWGRYDPSFGRGVTPTTSVPTATPSSPGGGGMSMPTLPGGDFAASIVGGIQNFSNQVVGNISDFTGRITQQTNPPPTASSSSSRGGGRPGGGGGHGGCACACACACAGCACACAGGGR